MGIYVVSGLLAIPRMIVKDGSGLQFLHILENLESGFQIG